jgi:hypothetical protein
MFTKVQATKAKNKQKGLYQTKTFYRAKETINRMKIQPTEWEKIFANSPSDKQTKTSNSPI